MDNCNTRIIALLTLLGRYRETHNKDKNESTVMKVGYNLFDKVLTSMSTICRSKYSTQMKQIMELENNPLKEPPTIYSNPCKQFENICSQLVNCISFLLTEKKQKIYNR